jgi:hypothetical protein
VQAPGDQQADLIAKLEQGKGVMFTQALADAIPKLKGQSKTKARDALSERLTRMKATTLREKLRDQSTEIRRAAALACAMKDDKQYIPDLIPLLEDGQVAVVHAAHVALKELTGTDLGPPADANRTERARAAAKWKEWWKAQSQK